MILLFSIVYWMIERQRKGSFVQTKKEWMDMNKEDDLDLFDFIYFTIVTQTTVGYGNIVPVSSLARFMNTFQLSTILFSIPASMLT